MSDLTTKKSGSQHSHSQINPAGKGQSPKIFGHRGSVVLAPENTKAAFDIALQHGVSVLETDVRTSKDGIPVIHHDAKLDRTTNGQGFVSNYTLKELKQLDAGYHFQSLSGTRTRGTGVQMMTLQEMLELYREIPVNVEIKHPKKEFAATVAEVIQATGREQSITVASFHSGVTEAFRQVAPQIETAATRKEIRQQYRRQFLPGNLLKRFFDNGDSKSDQNSDDNPAQSRLPYSTLQIPTHFKLWSLNFELTDSDFIDYLHAQSLTATYWTINSVEEMVLLASRGADGIVTDRPDLAAKVFGL